MAEKGLKCGINKTANMTTIVVPDIGDFENVEIIEILVKDGDEIKKNDPIVTLESDKSSVEVPSPFSGKIASLKVKIGDKVSKGSALAIIEERKGTTSVKSKKIKQEKEEEENPLILKNEEILPETEKIIKQAESVIVQKKKRRNKKSLCTTKWYGYRSCRNPRMDGFFKCSYFERWIRTCSLPS